MDSNNSLHSWPSFGDFGFALNNSNFSDRILKIEIMEGPCSSKLQDDRRSNITDWIRDTKRRRVDIKQETSVPDLANHHKEDILNGNHPDMDACAGAKTQDEEASMTEEALSGDKDTATEANCGTNCSSVVRVKELHVSSSILAARSRFFYKQFSDGTRESEQRHVTVKIYASEEAALMELLDFIYKNTLSNTSQSALLDVLRAAEKYEVGSCMQCCGLLLRSMPMTLESALLYLGLPISNRLMDEALRPLTDAAKQFLASRSSDYPNFLKEAMSFTLAGMEAVLSSDDLQPPSEDSVLDFALMWARTQYPKLDERRKILTTRLAPYIRYPYMTCSKLKEFRACSDFDHESGTKLVMEALLFKEEPLHRQRILAAETSALRHRRFIERACILKPVKVVEFELPRLRCVVYLDLKKEDCANLFPSGEVNSQGFYLGGNRFSLSARCYTEQPITSNCFGVFLRLEERISPTVAVEYEFSSRSESTEDFFHRSKKRCTFRNNVDRYPIYFGVPWTSFMANEDLYFINGILHCRAELTIKT